MVNVKVNPYKQMVVDSVNGDVTLSEGDKVRFVTESGEVKIGNIVKLIGKGDKLKIQLMPEGKECEELWSILQIADGSLRLYDETEDNDDEEEQDLVNGLVGWLFN